MPLIDLVSTFCYITATCITTNMQDGRPVASPLIATRQTANVLIARPPTTLAPALTTRTAAPLPVSSGAMAAAAPVFSSPPVPLTLSVAETSRPPVQNSLIPGPNSTSNGDFKFSNNSKNTVDSKAGASKSKIALTSKSGSDVRKNVRESSPYPTRYDYIDVEAVMKNDRIVKALFNCVMDKGPCTREGLELKRIIPHALQTECAKCTDRQRKQAGKVLAYMMHNKPDYWKMLWERFDPNNVYLKKFLADEKEDADNSTLIANKQIR